MKNHVTIGRDNRWVRLTIYPLECAMHGAWNLWVRGIGYICFKPPTKVFGYWWPAYFYISRNATPWAAWFYLGREGKYNG